MEVYAAMIKGIDNNVGRIVETLKTNGQFENTVIIFRTTERQEALTTASARSTTDSATWSKTTSTTAWGISVTQIR